MEEAEAEQDKTCCHAIYTEQHKYVKLASSAKPKEAEKASHKE